MCFVSTTRPAHGSEADGQPLACVVLGAPGSSFDLLVDVVDDARGSSSASALLQVKVLVSQECKADCRRAIFT